MIKFNNVDLSPFLRVMDVSGRGIMGADVELVSVPRKHGSLFKRRRMRERVITNRVRIRSKNLAELRKKIEELNLILQTEEIVPIIYADETDRVYYGISGAIEEDVTHENVGIHDTEISFVCPDPYKYSEQREIYIDTTSIKETTLPTLFAAQSAQNIGIKVDAPFMFRAKVTQPASQFSLKHVQTGKEFRLIYNLAAGDIVEVWFDWENKRKIYINENLQMTTFDLTSDWFTLLPGANSFLASPSLEDAKIIYRERWL